MAGLAPRVDYLAGFCYPLGGLAAGKPRVLCHGAEIFLSTGRELLYVYDREGRLLTVSAGGRGSARGGRGRGSASFRGAGALGEFVEKSSPCRPLPARRPGGVQVSWAGVALGGPGSSQGALRPVRPEGHLLPVLGPGEQVRRLSLGGTAWGRVLPLAWVHKAPSVALASRWWLRASSRGRGCSPPPAAAFSHRLLLTENPL